MEKIDQLEKDRYEILTIIDSGRDLIVEMEDNLRKKSTKIDMLSYGKVNKKASLADKILSSKSNLDDRRINNLYQAYLLKARKYLDLNKLLNGGLTKTNPIGKPKYRINLDLKMREQKISQQRQIRDIQRLNRYLFLEAKKLVGEIYLKKRVKKMQI